jgi:succinate dehydrogenase / fumarate reductase, cytochrome b subunit
MATRYTPLSSTVVTKVLVAVTGLGLFLFLVGHLAGNSLLYFGPASFNAYAHLLITNPLLIPAEIGLAGLFLLHIYKTATMWYGNRQARPVAYESKRWAGGTSRKSVSSSTMIWTGTATALFLVIHLRTFKFGPYYDAAEPGVRDLHRLVIEIFSVPLYVGFYFFAMVLLGYHLWHGVGSAFESLGASSARQAPRLLLLSKLIAVFIAGGFFAIPLWVYLFGARP